MLLHLNTALNSHIAFKTAIKLATYKKKDSFEEKIIAWYLRHCWTDVFKILNAI